MFLTPPQGHTGFPSAFIGWIRNLFTFISVLGLSSTGKLYPSTDAGVGQVVSGLLAGNGVPNNANGSNGDYYFRGDGTKAGNTLIYHKEGGSWVALVIA